MTRYVFLFVLTSFLLGTGVLPLTAQTSASNAITQSSTNPHTLVQQGRQLYESGQYEEAIASLQQAILNLQLTGDTLELAMAFSNLSLVYQAEAQWENAENAIKRSLYLLQLSPSSPDQSQLLAHAEEIQAKLEFTLGRTAEALELWQEAATHYAQMGDRDGYARSQIHRSLAWQELGFYRQALKTLVTPEASIENSFAPIQWLAVQPASLIQANAFRSLGNILRVVGAGSIGNIDDQIWIGLLVSDSSNLSDPIFSDSYLNFSRQALEKSLRIAEDLELSAAIATTHLDLGNTARAAYYRAKDAFDRVPTEATAVEAKTSFTQALNYYQQAATSALAITDSARGSIAITTLQAQFNQLSLLIDVNSWLHYVLQSDNPFLRSSLLPETRDRQLPQIESEIAQQLQAQLEQLPNSLTQLDHLPITRTTLYARINAAQSLITYFSSESSPASSLTPEQIEYYSQLAEELLSKSVQQTQSLPDQRAASYAVGHLAKLYEQQSALTQAQAHNTELLIKAQDLTQKALAIAEQLQASDITYQWQWQLGRILKSQNHPGAAIAFYEEAVDTLKLIRNDLGSLNNPDAAFSFRDSVEPVYRELVELLLPPSASLYDSNSTLSEITLQERQNSSTALLSDPEKARQFTQELQVLELENFLRCRLQDSLGVAVNEEGETQDLEAAVVYPIVLEDRLELLVKLPQALIRLDSNFEANRDQIEQVAQRFQSAVEFNRTNDIKTEGKLLYNWLIAPLEPTLRTNNIKTLVFILDSDLRNISLAALWDEVNQQYLVEKEYAIALHLGIQFPATSALQQDHVNALVAGINEGFEDFPPLEDIESHLEKIAAKISDQSILWNFTAQELREVLNSRPFPIVYLATHGQFSSNPTETFLVASGEKITFDQMRDVLYSRQENRSDPINLLVLAACKTAVGDRRAPLGIAGIAAQAGARSTLATLISVRTVPKYDLMEQFFDDLQSRNRTKAEALHLAQQEMLEQESNINEWAPYVLVGDWR